ncbi:sulfatase-like hydrolase/transferase [Spirosoma sp. HMF4905]|uniref:Sulfatase-like hydrolase/transferase n=1 Tax=Spirosoma arboris TaxID=2682092 RepID=A0A7K1S3T7_9BACT|nr:sulfatase [Spirosoma arboris]MVM28492.1 sulfatase-like hydrolase/transferase [Spirosoma arboris]
MNYFTFGAASTLLTGWLLWHSAPPTQSTTSITATNRKPNIVIVMADQWRADAFGYAGNHDVITPNLDKLAGESINARFCVASVPVCSPSRASMLTGQHAHTHGVFYNDRPLRNEAITLAEVCKQNGYQTGFIGKWHINGGLTKNYEAGRVAPIPAERRQGFDYWRALECTHNYNDSPYYNEVNTRFVWQQYDAISQTDSAIAFMTHKRDSPFLLVLAWGPPHDPYQTAPKEYRQKYADKAIALRPNVPASDTTNARRALRGYYAHINALDDCIGRLQTALKGANLDENTIFIFTSDHGDMLYSQGELNKQKPWDESIRIPFLLKYPAGLGRKGRTLDVPMTLTDVMPTVLSMSQQPIPSSVQGRDYAALIRHPRAPKPDDAALIACIVPFHQWGYGRGGREYRGVRTARYTYVRDLKGPWLLYDNIQDPFQLTNVVNKPDLAQTQRQLEALLTRKLREADDRFLAGNVYMDTWHYPWATIDSVGNPYYK